MKRVAFGIILAVLAAGMGCVHVPKRLDAYVNGDVRDEIQRRAVASLDFIEGKTDVLPRTEEVSRLAPLRIFAVATAYAGTNDAGGSILLSLRSRNAQIVDLKARRLVGETVRGYLALRNEDSLDARQRNEIQRTVAAENKERKLLHEEDARVEKAHSVTVSMVERGYATERLKRARVGEWVQIPSLGEDFEAFKTSPAGQRLGTDCIPEAWVVLK